VAHSRGFRGRTTGSARRKSSWEVGPGGTASTALSSSSSQLAGTAVTPSGPGATMVRIRGLFVIQLTLATGAGDGFFGAVGIGLATLAAVTAGVGSLPMPIDEVGDENWLWHEFFSVHSPVVSSTDLGAFTTMKIPIDSKAMRIFDDGMSIYGALQAVETGTATANWWMDSRTLVKLP